MATEVSICNLALSRSGGGRIQALTEASKEARECNLHYEFARDAVLRDFDWGFASKRATLGLLTDTYTGWTYAYAMPSDYIKIREILDAQSNYTGTYYDVEDQLYKQAGKPKFEIASNDSGSRPIILTDIASAEIRYTAKITDVNAFDSLFQDALAWRLAAELAMSLRGKADERNALLNIYQIAIGNAEGANASEDNNPQKEVNSYVRSRG